MKIILLILLNLPLLISAQNVIKGKVIDASSNKAISDATIYVNGTTIGTTSDMEGNFTLEKAPIPCYLGVSHVEYKPSMIDFSKANITTLIIKLDIRNVQLQQISVSDINRRQTNINIFKNNFIGSDYFGQKAILLNDNNLFFTHEYQDKKTKLPSSMRITSADGPTIKHEKDGNYITHKKKISTSVKTNASLNIDMPYLGYNLQAELIDYLQEYGDGFSSQCSFLGYYFFIPYKKHLIKYDKRRKEAYYNSSLHFCRALYNKALKANGYQILEITGEGKSEKTLMIDLDSLNTYRKDNTLFITGLKDRMFTILYNCKSDGSPKDLNTHKLNPGPQSLMFFSKDTCQISSNGIISNNNILFGGSISEKKVGAMLPENYYPEEKK